jgi:hypothetical protein
VHNFANYFREPVGSIIDGRFQSFYYFCEFKIKELMMLELGNQGVLNHWLQLLLKDHGVHANLLLTGLKEVTEGASVCDESALKRCLSQAKTLDALWKVIASEEKLVDIFRMPMSCLAEHKGAVVWFVCSWSTPAAIEPPSEDLSVYFSLLASLININKLSFLNPSAIKFVRISSREFLIVEVGDLMPRIVTHNVMVRPSLFARLREVWAGGGGYLVKPGRKEEEQQNRKLMGGVEEMLELVVKDLDRLEKYIVHPSEFSHFMHFYGLNIAFLGEVMNKVEGAFVKGILKTEALVRSFKAVFRKRMQEELIAARKEANLSTPNS